jgi:hypothetical protein
MGAPVSEAPEPAGAESVAILRRYVVGIAEQVYGCPVDMPDLRQAQLVLGRMFDRFENLCRVGGHSEPLFDSAAGPDVDFSWLRHLPADSLARFQADFGAAVQAGDWPALDQLMVEWRDTALIHADPELYARLANPV